MKTYDSHYLCEASVLNPVVSSGLQCKGELVKDSTAACDVSHNSPCESSRVSKAAIGSNAPMARSNVKPLELECSAQVIAVNIIKSYLCITLG